MTDQKLQRIVFLANHVNNAKIKSLCIGKSDLQYW